MPRTKLDDLTIQALGVRRTQIAEEIKRYQAFDIAALETEFAEIEAKLKEIDPEILSLEEERDAEIAAAAKEKADAQARELAARALESTGKEHNV